MMSTAVLPFRLSPLRRAQALADLYRARSTLANAGIPGEYVVGSTEDGSPWLAVCAADGDALIHIAVIDGEVIADSPALAQPLRGRQVGALLKALLERLPLQTLKSNGAFLAIAAALALHAVNELSDGASFEMPMEAQPLMDALAALPAMVVLAAVNREVARFIVDGQTGEKDVDQRPSEPATLDDAEAIAAVPNQAAPPIDSSRDAPTSAASVPHPNSVELPLPTKSPDQTVAAGSGADEIIQFRNYGTVFATHEAAPVVATSSEVSPTVAMSPAVGEIQMTSEEAKRIIAEWEEEQARIPRAEVSTRGSDKVLTYLEGDYTTKEFIYPDGSKFLVFGLDKQAPPEIYYIP